ncbi:transcriptional regulator family: Fungal Specific TF [Paecilomyces variotii]|nr:transcriptional regulator family: Fungal Specific TF [Paecilomyces variotii]
MTDTKKEPEKDKGKDKEKEKEKEKDKQKPVRKRNVVSRGRTGCLTCRRRRLKCDEAKPACHSCTRLNLKCEGYAQRISFKDQTDLVVERAKGKSTKKRKASEPPIKEEDSTDSVHQPSDSGSPAEKSSASPPATSSITFDNPIVFAGEPSNSRRLDSGRTQIDSQQSATSTPDRVLGDPLASFDSLLSSTTDPSGGSMILSDVPIKSHLAEDFFTDSGEGSSTWVVAQEGEGPFDQHYQTEFARSSPDTHSEFTRGSPSSEVAFSAAYGTPPSISLVPSSPSRPLPNAFLSLCGAYEFPEDVAYYEYSAGHFQSLSRVLPLSELFRSEPVSPHVYNAALALAALNLSSMEDYSKNPVVLRQHAFQHSLKAVQGIREALSSPDQSKALRTPKNVDTGLSLFATIILLANFELQRGSLFSWRSHMRGAASCLGIWHKDMAQRPAGMLLAKAFARMALLLRLYNEDYSVTTPDVLSPSLAAWLNSLLARSSELQDRLLLLVEEWTQIEIKYREQPELEDQWIAFSDDFLSRLDEWRKNIPPSDLPVESNGPASVTVYAPSQQSADSSGFVYVPALCFPNSADPCTAAVNYATYLCLGMRSRTRYSVELGKIVPPDSDETALMICRIAAGISPVSFGQSYTYAYGMLPSVVGAARWSSNPGLKAWVRDYLTKYKSNREGIWNVSHSIRLLDHMDREYARRGAAGWEMVAVRVLDEPTDPSPDLEENDSSKPFKIVMRGRTRQGRSEDVVEVP